MQDLLVILKWHNLQSLEKALNFIMELKFFKSDVYFLNRRKKCRWPLITSFQCIYDSIGDYNIVLAIFNTINDLSLG